MLSHDLGVDRARLDHQLAAEHLAQARGVEHRTGSDHAVEG